MDFDLDATGASVRVRGKQLVVAVHPNSREAGLSAVYWKAGDYKGGSHFEAYVAVKTTIIELAADADFAGHPRPIVEVDQYLNLEQATALRDSLTKALEDHAVATHVQIEPATGETVVDDNTPREPSAHEEP